MPFNVKAKNNTSYTDTEIPFFPSYSVEKSNNVNIWWFERRFSQAQYGSNSRYGTNSCTVIAIMVAEIIAFNSIETRILSDQLQHDIVVAFGLGILRGNYTYGKYLNSGELADVNLSIPEAMKAAADYIEKLQEWFYVHVSVPNNNIYARTATQKITTVLRDGLKMWRMVNFKKEYFFVIIIADSRSVLLCFQQNGKCVTFFDSHFHIQYGAVIAQSQKKNLFNLISWIIDMFINMYRTKPEIFELSFIPIKSLENSL